MAKFQKYSEHYFGVQKIGVLNNSCRSQERRENILRIRFTTMQLVQYFKVSAGNGGGGLIFKI